ncbi:MAG TPA: hypothetical protein VFJ65_06755, partial [Solirubrobacterales bacterium]|nr:hypothetical protein [Solirubrobacterales bacterium]
MPVKWEEMQGEASPFYRRQLREMSKAMAELSQDVPLLGLEEELGGLVGSSDNESQPVHRWYPFKEAFSYRLPGLVKDWLEIEPGGLAIDVFGGVGTSALSLRGSSFDRVLGIEYSPFAQFVGQTKVDWTKLDPGRIAHRIPRALAFEAEGSYRRPGLSSFSNLEIFTRERLRSLLAARDHLRGTEGLRPSERQFFLLGLAAIVEEASGAMKDGRALRIKRDRKRVSKLLRCRHEIEPQGDFVRDALARQWWAMQEDLVDLAGERAVLREVEAHHLRGDARELGEVRLSPRRPALQEGVARLSVFSPPYLNCIDYSELYKLELWLLEFVKDQKAFKNLRLGTLRSHPSVKFPERGYLASEKAAWVNLVELVSSFVERNGARREIGQMIRNYFEDMYRVFTQQLWVLEPEGWMVCIVGNSTFSRRLDTGGVWEEVWRIPLLTDVILAAIARSL